MLVVSILEILEFLVEGINVYSSSGKEENPDRNTKYPFSESVLSNREQYQVFFSSLAHLKKISSSKNNLIPFERFSFLPMNFLLGILGFFFPLFSGVR